LTYLLEHAAPDDWVMVHDAARPCLTQGELDHLIAALHEHPVGGLLGVPITDTVKRVDPRDRALETLDRSELWRAFTPQMFRLHPLQHALRDAVDHGCQVTDEAAAMERMGHAPQMVQGLPGNIKITHPHDLALAEFHLRRHEAGA
ncbi:MAG TPA: 2-C-methyl-D-erythritol 4-phosphate cytidylyltransferase, partial [Pseudodesulfovibrio sp.]|nr:2-C-methyl-D-erythritol 4-phosphate cytidylyltransferase [Pseudodesulfovibrio sp.]